MLKVLVTGANGFVGRNLSSHLKNRENIKLFKHLRGDTEIELRRKLKQVDIIYHLAAVNRPPKTEDFKTINTGLTDSITNILQDLGSKPKIIFSSSTQAVRHNPYGQSKKQAEEILENYAKKTGAEVINYRLTNIFGKWCKPNYNSVVATFCHNIALGKEVNINDPDTNLHLVYIDDVVSAFMRHLDSSYGPGYHLATTNTTFNVSLRELSDRLYSFKAMRDNLRLPDFADTLTKRLYTTYLSYLPRDKFSYKLSKWTDDRGWLAEIIKSEHMGQVFVSTTRPGITRGNHYHHSKVEKFCVIQGEAVIRFRQTDDPEIMEYRVSGSDIEIVDIPPGYTHNIENIGNNDMVVLFWANEIFNPDMPDTYYLEV